MYIQNSDVSLKMHATSSNKDWRNGMAGVRIFPEVPSLTRDERKFEYVLS